jgi:hypothetical protein
MSEKYACPEDGCSREFYTQVGLDVHIKTHLPTVKEEKVIEKPEILPKPVEKKEKKVVTDKIVSELKKDYLTEKEAKELWKKRTKRMRKKSTIKVSEKLTKKNFCKLLEVHNWRDQKGGEKKFTDRSYVIKQIRKMSNDWFSYQAIGNNGQKISWREGPINGRYHITIPSWE